jgi:purine-binding chemotaxis protein CheW
VLEPGQARPLRLVCFRVREQELALTIESVRETIRMRPMTRVFLTPPWLVGIFSLRGEIVPAIDIAPWLGMGRTTAVDESRLVVLRHPSKGLAILADALSGLRMLEPSSVAAPPPTLAPEQARLLRGVAATPTGTVRIVDPDALFRSERLASLTTQSEHHQRED